MLRGWDYFCFYFFAGVLICSTPSQAKNEKSICRKIIRSVGGVSALADLDKPISSLIERQTKKAKAEQELFTKQFDLTYKDFIEKINATASFGTTPRKIIKSLLKCCLSVKELASAFEVEKALVYRWRNENDTVPFPIFYMPRLSLLVDTVLSGSAAKWKPWGFSEAEALAIVKNIEERNADPTLIESTYSEVKRQLEDKYKISSPFEIFDVVHFRQWKSFQNFDQTQLDEDSLPILKTWSHSSKPEQQISEELGPREVKQAVLKSAQWFLSQEEGVQQKLIAEYNNIRSLVSNWRSGSSLDSNLRREAKKQEETIQTALHDSSFHSLDILATMLRVGGGEALANKYGTGVSAFYSVLDGKMEIPPLFALRLLEIWKNRKTITASRFGFIMGMDEGSARKLLASLNAFVEKDTSEFNRNRSNMRSVKANPRYEKEQEGKYGAARKVWESQNRR